MDGWTVDGGWWMADGGLLDGIQLRGGLISYRFGWTVEDSGAKQATLPPTLDETGQEREKKEGPGSMAPTSPTRHQADLG